MKTLVVACPGFSTNGWVFTVMSVLPCTDVDGDVPPPYHVSRSVTVVPLVLEKDTARLFINWIDFFGRVPFVLFI